MTLSVIAGPPNSGRTGAVLDGFRAALAREPVLVVPTVDDVERFEGELTGGGEAVVGASVCTFERLFAMVARATGVEARPFLSAVQRRRIAGEAVSRSRLRLLAASSRRPGFAAALDELIGELQAAAIDPDTLREHATAEAGPHERELADLYGRFCAIRDELGRADAHSLAALATAALRARPDDWGARPVFLYGFDDLTVEQLELVRELWRTSEVTIALPYEEREVLLAARSALLAELRDTEGLTITELPADQANTASATLFELERRFGEPRDQGEPVVENDGGLALLASAGELAEVEAVGAKVARLLHEGVPAGEIAIVLRDPAAGGSLFRRVLTRYRIPVAVEADIAIARTTTGSGLLALLEAAAGRRRASDLLAHLRTPGVASPNRVDWFERALRRGRMRGAEEALAAWRNGTGRDDTGRNGAGQDGRRGNEVREIDAIREAGSGPELLRKAAREARWIAEAALYRDGAVASEDRALELRAGAEIERALTELADLGLPHSPGELIAAVAELQVPLWRGPTEGRVRVISPYRARARRVRHLFVASLQDGDFPRRDTGGPLLSDDARSALALPPRKQAEVEDRYLFSVCLSRPQERLWLSWRSADDEGGATARSPFVDEVRALLTPALPEDLAERDEALLSEATTRGVADSVFSPGTAPSEDELARALAARDGVPRGLSAREGTDQAAPPQVPGLDEATRERLAGRLRETASRLAPERLRPGPLTLPAVLERMRATDRFGPRTLEEYARCPYRWFVDHELKPQRIEPEGDALTAGGIAHEVLERLYAEQPGGEPRPTPATLADWRRRAHELIQELGPEGLPRERADTSAELSRVEGLVLAFLGDEAAAEVPFLPAPELAEASFGFEDSEKPELRLATGGVHGRIDRIDIGPAGEALVQDYKLSSKVDGGRGMLDRGKLQLQLYLLAARELWGLDLAGGLYRPLAATSKRQPKGILRQEAKADLAGLDTRRDDHLDDAEFEATLADAAGRAEEIMEAIHAGEIGRRPLGGKCPEWCDFQPICRRERGLPEEEPEAESADEGEG